MFNNIAFVGGIHGVGKSTICRQICIDLNITYLSASEVLQWKQIKPNFRDKKVEDIPFTQDRLIIGLSNLIYHDNFYLLDGHYCLLNKDNNIYDIPQETFEQINPRCLSVITGNIFEIKKRLESRDKLNYTITLLNEMQKKEISYAKKLSESLNKPVTFGQQDNYQDILESIRLNMKK